MIITGVACLGLVGRVAGVFALVVAVLARLTPPAFMPLTMATRLHSERPTVLAGPGPGRARRP